MLCRYTPVTPELREIGEKLGNYLHAPKSKDLIDLDQWKDFEQLLERGFELLEYSCKGNLLGVPLKEPRSSRVVFNMVVSDDQNDLVSQIYKQGGEITMHVDYAIPPLDKTQELVPTSV